MQVIRLRTWAWIHRNGRFIFFVRWVNQKRVGDSHLFSGGFLGMDNISCIERSNPPQGTHLTQVE